MCTAHKRNFNILMGQGKLSLVISRPTYTLHTPFFPNGSTAPWGPRPPHFRGFTITLRHTTLGRTPLDEGPARHRDLYLTTHNTHKRQTSMPPVGFETTIPVSERPQTHALDRTATAIGTYAYTSTYILYSLLSRQDSELSSAFCIVTRYDSC
jgi:hypothetical protein